MSNIPTVDANDLAWLTTEDMIEVDRVMIEDLHIELIQMMENAGRNLALLAQALWTPKSVSVYVGPGGNGGGGLVAARHLAVQGVEVEVITVADVERFTPIPRHQLDIVERMGIPVRTTGELKPDGVIDAMLGYSLGGAPRDPIPAAVEAIADTPTIALDVPTGVDSTTGETPGAFVTAQATLTLAMPKQGLRNHPAIGDLYLGNISVPASVYDGIGYSADPPFSHGPILRVIGEV